MQCRFQSRSNTGSGSMILKNTPLCVIYRHGRTRGLPNLYRARAQRRIAWPQSKRKPERAAAPLRGRVPAQARFPALEIILNGGVTTLAQVERHLAHIDGVMLGRAAYHNPWLLAGIDHRFYQANAPVAQRADVIPALKAYYARESARGAPLKAVTR